ncbi:UxaA family hydrolase [Paenibacillus turpanensis]|uniref:UxaA family hydrolase n=1 Tax=Paenibacillus turpanensis TaxID=2689078 RepID=UPI00140A8F65|nr:UxaA family hydrolase [Paenibacillus turpanensis]
MAHSIESGADALVMHEMDQVATTLRDLSAGEAIRYRKGNQVYELLLLNAVPFGHKVAISPVKQGELVRKYGEVIGCSTQHIEAGEHVHIHNLEGIRGRGDQISTMREGDKK